MATAILTIHFDTSAVPRVNLTSADFTQPVGELAQTLFVVSSSFA